MVAVRVSSHQGRAYGAQPDPHQLLHSSGAADLLPRPLGPRHRAFSGQDASGRWRRLVWVELGVQLGFKHWIKVEILKYNKTLGSALDPCANGA